MLNVTLIRGNNQYAAAHYFSAADDYYAKDKENIGEWQGQGAQALGLTGPVEQMQLSRLLDGQLPNGERIQTTFDPTDNKKRMGLDLTFSAPKSVSMQALVAGDKDVTAAHDRAVTRALEQVERLAEARKKIKGKSYRERTGNMVIGKFRHEMSRAKDPQLHTHSVVLNMTQRADGAWRALSNEDIFLVQHEVDALYKTELAHGLKELGYAIRLVDDKGNFELAHISRDQIEGFSARSLIIEEALANQGKTRATATTLEKQIISLATRPRKDESDRELVKQYWVEKSRELGIDYGPHSHLDAHTYEIGDGFDGRSTTKKTNNYIKATSLPASFTPAQAVVQYAINHLTEREAVVRETLLASTALRRAVGLAGPDEVRAEIKRLVGHGALIEAVPAYHMADRKNGPVLSSGGWKSYLQELKGWSDKQAQQYVSNAIKQGSLVPAEKRYTTHKALRREKAILAIERSGRGAVEPIMTATAVRKALELTMLNDGQRSAVETIVSTKNRFVGIQGDAGTGKTYTVKQAVALVSQTSDMGEGYRIVALAPYGNQVKTLKNEGLEAHTLASFLATRDKPIDGKTIVLLDESGVVGARQMEQVMRIVEKAGARMVFLGDTKQTEAIEAGKPFAQLQQDGMQTARISEIQRQKEPELKIAVKYAADGRITQSIAHIKHVEELKETTERHRAIVNDYIKLTDAERRETLIIAGTNEARREINRMVRESLDLSGKGRKFESLTRVDMTQAQRRFAPSYQRNMVVQPEKDYKKAGLKRGEIYSVKEALPGNALVLQHSDGTTITINPRKATQLSVYHLERTELAVGDTIRINRNDPGRDLTNGDRMRVASVIGGMIKLESVEQKDGRPMRSLELPVNKPLHLEHAYVSTVHSSQGLTKNRVLITLDTKSRTTSMNLYYVAISRARNETRIYTNSIRELPTAIARCFDKSTALAIQRERQLHRRHADLQSKGAVDGKQVLQHQKLERQHKQLASSKKSLEYGRFG
ncbi:MobF family relaxase [Xylella fastidiosa]|uniref:MobF family relaxase n=1 Tax=Xylella fastidiosa TaxID=2371 RepID=UPI000FFE482E|nr:MobF family relaxase [Xylella fastidiosa]RWA36899.1 AAA family ATPase [Xylella fastidiosa subsp. multiplex]